MKSLLQKLLTSAVLSTVLFQFANAQDLQWVNGYTDNLSTATDVKADASGNVYIAGGFTGTIDFDPGAGVSNLTSNGSFDIYVQKLDASGNFVWAKSIGGSSSDGVGALTLDASGNIYVTGWFQGTNIDFDPGAGSNTLTSAGVLDAYVLKLNNSGNFQWVYQGGGTGNDDGIDLAVDASGNVYLTGGTNGGDFDNGAGTTTLGGNGGDDVYVAKLNATGNFQWGLDFGGTGRDDGFSLKLESSGDVFVGGIFSNTVDFNPTPTVENHTSNGLTDAFLVQIDAAGNYQNALTWGAL